MDAIHGSTEALTLDDWILSSVEKHAHAARRQGQGWTISLHWNEKEKLRCIHGAFVARSKVR
eukprot:scaffold128220_cov17-Tisochrysis_lutea.AAC.1